MIAKESYSTTFFDSLTQNLENDPELYELVFQRVMNGKLVAFNTTNPVIHCAHLYGILADSEDFTGSSTKNIVRMQKKKKEVGRQS